MSATKVKALTSEPMRSAGMRRVPLLFLTVVVSLLRVPAHGVAAGDKGYIRDIGVYVTLFAVGHSTTLLVGVLTGVTEADGMKW